MDICFNMYIIQLELCKKFDFEVYLFWNGCSTLILKEAFNSVSLITTKTKYSQVSQKDFLYTKFTMLQIWISFTSKYKIFPFMIFYMYI